MAVDAVVAQPPRRVKRRWEDAAPPAPPLAQVAFLPPPPPGSHPSAGVLNAQLAVARLTGLPAPPIGASPLSFAPTVPSLNPTSSAANDCRLYVGALALEVTSAEVQQLFGVFGPVRVEMFFDPATGKGKGFCFVEFGAPDAAKAVRSVLPSTIRIPVSPQLLTHTDLLNSHAGTVDARI